MNNFNKDISTNSEFFGENAKINFAIFLLFCIYCSVFFIFGDNTYVLIHDNLDSHFAINKTLIKSGLFFSNNFEPIPEMGGAVRLSLGNEINFMLWLDIMFGQYWGYAINQVIIRFVAFFGMLIFLRDRIIFNLNKSTALLVALLFSLLPFYT
ncbi:DUF6044 family protein, partial [Amylibacter sp.]|nr:DUF6044 family protein [Amylibacter sp.]